MKLTAKQSKCQEREDSTSKSKNQIIVLLTLIEDWEKLCRKSLSNKKVRKDPLAFAEIIGEFLAIKTIKKFIIEIRRNYG